jgi:hypothetical protein
MDQPINAHDDAQHALDAGRLPYHSPLLRLHGTLRDLTQKSADKTQEGGSDVNSKEHIAPISWDRDGG